MNDGPPEQKRARAGADGAAAAAASPVETAATTSVLVPTVSMSTVGADAVATAAGQQQAVPPPHDRGLLSKKEKKQLQRQQQPQQQVTTGKSRKKHTTLNSKKARQKRRKGEKPPAVLKYVPCQPGDAFQYTPTPAAMAAARRLFEGKVVLAPMVRANSTPLRVLALQYGANTVFTEEIIDYKMLGVQRRANAALGTVDYVTEKVGKKGKRVQTLVLRVDPAAERGRLVFQVGTSNGSRALAAVQKSGVLADVAGVDVNMGCPKHFSVQGGMGAALLANQRNAAEVVHTLASNLGDVPVTAKIRLIPPSVCGDADGDGDGGSGDGDGDGDGGGGGADATPAVGEGDDLERTIATTVAFMRVLERAGAAGISVHLRTPETPSERAANWAAIRGLVAAGLGVPLTINGDFMAPRDIRAFRAVFPASLGVMVARGALRNCSMFAACGAPPAAPVAPDGAGTAAAPAAVAVAAAAAAAAAVPPAGPGSTGAAVLKVAPTAAASIALVAAGRAAHKPHCRQGSCVCMEVRDDADCPDTLDAVVRKLLTLVLKYEGSFNNAKYILQQAYKWSGALRGSVGRVVNGAKDFPELVAPWVDGASSPSGRTLADKVDEYGSKILTNDAHFVDAHHYSDAYFAADAS